MLGLVNIVLSNNAIIDKDARIGNNVTYKRRKAS